MLKEGDKAPDFSLPDKDGKVRKLSDFKGKKLVLYFYPKDMTSGCTIEACSFRDDFSEYEKKGIAVVGISADDEESHRKFTEKHGLPFTLLSDKSKDVVSRYGVYGEKKFLGKTYKGINRMTFIIDGKGIIRKIFPKVDVKVHSKEILEGLDS